MNADAIATELRQRIERGRESASDGALPPGSPLPSVNDLAEAHDVSRETAHKAVRQLHDLGLVHPRRNRPAIVASSEPVWIIRDNTYDRSVRQDPHGLTTWEQQCRERGLLCDTEHRCEGRVPTPERYAYVLDGSECLLLKGEGWVTPKGPDGQPDPSARYVGGIYTAYVPAWVADAVPRLSEPRDASNRNEWVGGLDTVIEQGIDQELVSRHLRITGRSATDAEAERFELERPAPVLVEVFSACTGTGEAVYVVEMVKLLGTVAWEITVPIND